MKLIHCADIHLDSSMRSHFDPVASASRRNEILGTFERMVGYALNNRIEAIMISGDMFDTPNTRELTRKTVLSCIASNPGIAFFYLKGNHDDNNFIDDLDEIPHNLKLFGNKWTCYDNGEVSIYGAELPATHGDDFYAGLIPDESRINIVMLHGQISESSDTNNRNIDLNQLRNRGIDYLALGHIHSFCVRPLDSRGILCYPGCLEGRGFDECGDHGFVVVDIPEQTHRLSYEFVPFARRRIASITADVSGCMSTHEMTAIVAEILAGADCDASSIVRLVLTGELDAECEKDIAYLTSAFSDQYYYFEAVDETKLKINIEDYLLDESLKGEFIRTVYRDNSLSEEEKSVIIRYGLQALAGEEAK